MASSTCPIDLTMPSRDHLSALPPELLYTICDFLFPTHNPDAAFYDPIQRPKIGSHPVIYLAQANKTLYAETQAWACHFLRQHATITKYKDLKDRNRQAARNFLLSKTGGLMAWMSKHCIFCGKTSVRTAILVNGFRCCAWCDREQWPEKITRTEAKKCFDLRDQHLPLGKDGLRGAQWPRLSYGTYLSSNVATTMYLRADVRRLAERVHGGDLEGHLARRKREKNKKVRRAERGRSSSPGCM